LIATGQLSDAIKQLKRGIGKVEHPRLYFILAKVYKTSNKKKRAIEALENYLDEAGDKAPDRRAASKLLQRLKR
jgi:predicted Zn-dependent protease